VKVSNKAVIITCCNTSVVWNVIIIYERDTVRRQLKTLANYISTYISWLVLQKET
jgi:hypothetical protein